MTDREGVATATGGQPETDIRLYFAEERTYLAWIRTGIASMGFGFVVARFGLYLAELRGDTAPQGRFSLWSGTALIVIGVAVTLLSTHRHLRVVDALNRGQLVALRRPSQLAIILSLSLALIGVATAIYLVFARYQGGRSS
ncbi:MAG TPA: DUF202 domain-containing protein [Gemmatimonadaceae bacterium]